MTTWSSSPVDMSGHVGGTRFINCILCSISQARLSRPFQDPLCASHTAKAAIYSNSNKSWVQLEGTDDLLLLLFLQASVSVESLSCRQTSFFCQARRMSSLLPTAPKGARDCNLTLWCAGLRSPIHSFLSGSMKTIIERQCSASPKLGVAAGWTTAISMTVAADESLPTPNNWDSELALVPRPMVRLLKSSRPMLHGSMSFITSSRRCWRFYEESQRRCPSTARQVWLWVAPQKNVGLHSRSLLQIRLLLACQDILVTFSTPPKLHCKHFVSNSTDVQFGHEQPISLHVTRPTWM